MTADQTKLLPCPFCGGQPHVYQNSDYYVICNTDCCPCSHVGVTIAAWNRRAGGMEGVVGTAEWKHGVTFVVLPVDYAGKRVVVSLAEERT